MSFSEKLSSIEEKVELLSKQLKYLKAKNAALSEEKQTLLLQLQAKEGKIITLEQQLQNAVAEAKQQDVKSSQRLKKEIDQYIKDIDKCIEWLQQH